MTVPSPNVATTTDEGRMAVRTWTGPARAPRADTVGYEVKPTFSMRSSSVAFTVDPVTSGFIR